MDVLHPLSSIHWEECIKVNKKLPRYCAVLHDIVAVLVRTISSYDRVYISSINLDSWKVITLPYQYMSLTTYKSQFVAVGGCDNSLLNKSNLLFTSDTGLEWQPSLPPMPTPRSCTTSVGITSPEALVVASRLVIDVLLGNTWYTVLNPIPIWGWRVQSVVHDSRLYFCVRTSPKHIVFSCLCESLVTLCNQSTSNKTAQNTPLWMEEDKLHGVKTAVSYSSRLVYIDKNWNLKTHSQINNTLMEIIARNKPSHALGPKTATTLPNGDLLCCGFSGIIYRGKLTVSSFDPDTLFMPDVLYRLEAVMDTEIISVFTEEITQLFAVYSGVKLELPGARLQHVDDILFHWCEGHSHRLPTWRQLLEVLQQIGLVELSQQITGFMNDPREFRYVNAYRKFIKTKETLELLFLKILFLGPPRLGKSTTRRRIMGLIIDLLSAGEADVSHPSTGAVECGHNMIVQGAVLTGTEWSSVENLIDEACMLFHNFVDNVQNIKETSRESVCTVNDSQDDQLTNLVPASQSISLSNLFSKFLALFQRTDDSSVESSNRTFISDDTNNSKTIPRSAIIASGISNDIPELVEIFKTSSQQPRFWEDMKHSFQAYLKFEDTGGQPELIDMLPAFTVGPGLYLLFFSYELSLKSQFPVYYRMKSGESTVLEQSTVTLEEMLLTSLSSISCSNAAGNSASSVKASNPDMKEIFESSKHAAYIIGTHKDKVASDEHHIEKFDKELQNVMRDTDFLDKVVYFHSEGKLVLPVNNMSGGVEEVKEIREMLEKAINKHFKKLKIPAVWLLFSLCLRSRKLKTASFSSCLELAEQFNMSPDETKVALWFLHHHAGVLMYFPDVPGLEDLVIIDNQIIYKSVTSLILKAMTFENVGQITLQRFRETGQFVLKDLIQATNNISGDYIPPIKLLTLLEYLHIVSHVRINHESRKIDVDQEIVYLMPCVLLHATEDELDSISTDESCPSFIAPLIVRFRCGYVPTGVFPALIACLIGNSSFMLAQEGIMYKNLVQFRYGPLDTLVTFTSRPKFYEIIISELPIVQHEPHFECVAIRKEVEAMFEKVSSRMNYGYFMDYQFGFECPTHPGKQHVCVVASFEIMRCVQVLTNKKPIKMEDCHKMWFQEFWTSAKEQKAGGTLMSSKDMSSEYSLGPDDLGKVYGEICQARVQWKFIGLQLGLTPDTLDSIEHDHHKAEPRCLEMLKKWLTNGKDRNWSKLADVLQNETVGHTNIANKIREEHNC